MNSAQQDRVAMFVTVDQYLTSIELTIEPVPFLKENHDVLKATIPLIRATAKEQELSYKGMTETKNQEKTDLVKAAIKTSEKLVSFAELTNNKLLSGEITITNSRLQAISEAKFISFCQNIYDKAQANLDQLQTYGITTKSQMILNDAINVYSKAVDQLKMHRVNHRQLTDLVAKQIAIADAVLFKIDKVMLAIKSEQVEIYKGYIIARKVIPSSNATISFMGKFIYAENALPFKGVVVTFQLIAIKGKPATANPITRKSAKKGGMNVKNLPDGIYELTIFYEGYITQIITITIVTGKTAKLTVKMVKK